MKNGVDKNEIIIQLKGGLGNQLFLYAYGLYNKTQGKGVLYNIDWFKKKPNRDYLLNSLYKGIEITTIFPTHRDYYQDLKYTEPVKEKMMLPHDDVDVIAMHIRRGDKVDNPRYKILTKEYYYNALKLLPEKDIYIFSDDILWCKKHFPGYTYVDLEVLDCFHLMRSCRYKVIANSTFSWWCAYLSNHTEVIVPDYWRKKNAPSKWIRCK